jgi:hypothetical protein
MTIVMQTKKQLCTWSCKEDKWKPQKRRFQFVDLGTGWFVIRIMGHVIFVLVCPEKLSESTWLKMYKGWHKDSLGEKSIELYWLWRKEITKAQRKEIEKGLLTLLNFSIVPNRRYTANMQSIPYPCHQTLWSQDGIEIKCGIKLAGVKTWWLPPYHFHNLLQVRNWPQFLPM